MKKKPERSPDSPVPAIDRRSFLGSLGTGAAAMAVTSLPLPWSSGSAHAAEVDPVTGEERQLAAFAIRRDAAQLAYDRGVPDHPDNGDEAAYPTRFASYSKGLPHNALGEVDGSAYDALLSALGSGDRKAFETIPMGLGRKLTNPQAGLAFDLEGPDSHQMAIPPAPRFDSAQEAAEMGELYWMALLRAEPFARFGHSAAVDQASADLSRFSDFRGPKAGGRVTSATIFRGFTAGDLVGPFVSQFLLKDIPFGSLTIVQRQETVRPVSYLTDYASWLNVQNGGPGEQIQIDPRRRYIRNMFDLAHYVYVDALYEAYLNACLILIGMNAPLDSGNPYRSSSTQIGFGTFGNPHILSLVTEVATRALKCVWYQKWFVHRRLRPEEFGGRVHNHLTGAASYPIHSEILNSSAVRSVFSRYGTYLLPMAFPDGCPTHPAYGAGHATVAGACVTILKAWFDESFVIPDPVVANEDGFSLVPYKGPDAGSLTLGGELDKVAANIAIGRNMGGVHWRSDYEESLKLGEAIAVGILEEEKACYSEQAAFTLTRFDGTTITI